MDRFAVSLHVPSLCTKNNPNIDQTLETFPLMFKIKQLQRIYKSGFAKTVFGAQNSSLLVFPHLGNKHTAAEIFFSGIRGEFWQAPH